MARRVLLVEDAVPIRKAINAMIRSECEVVGEVIDGTQVLGAAKELSPDTILLDVSLPGISGIMLLPLLRSSLPDVAIIMLTNHSEAYYVNEALRRGADDYVLKGDALSELLPAIRRSHSKHCSHPARHDSTGIETVMVVPAPRED